MTIAFIAQGENAQRWLPLLEDALPGERFTVWPEIGEAAAVDIALVARPPTGVLATLPNLKLIQSLWMGVDGLLADPSLPARVPIARVIDPGMVAAMCETVLARVLDWHRELYRYRAAQAVQRWAPLPQRLAGERTIGLLGLGALGTAVARRLLDLGFEVIGWSRSPKRVAGIASRHGETGFAELLERSGALVCLLPLTAATRGLLDRRVFARMPDGACLISVGRGAHVVEPDLLAALDSGRLAHAYLDVFETEPLPAAHPFWRHPSVSLTPHVAALTVPRTAAPCVVDNIGRVRRGEAPSGLVDRLAGY